MGFVYLVPARFGSQGIPLKNLQKIGNRTLVEIAIEEALLSQFRGVVWVNSDSESITDLGASLGARPYVRPIELAGNDSTADEVVKDFISKVSLEVDDVVIYLQPTSPMRSKYHIEKAIRMFLEGGGKPVTSVTRVTQHPSKMLRRNLAGELVPLNENGRPTSNRQDLEETLIPNGAIYVFTVNHFLQTNGFPVQGSIPYIMEELESLDVDSPLDLRIARLLSGEKEDERANDGK